MFYGPETERAVLHYFAHPIQLDGFEAPCSCKVLVDTDQQVDMCSYQKKKARLLETVCRFTRLSRERLNDCNQEKDKNYPAKKVMKMEKTVKHKIICVFTKYRLLQSTQQKLTRPSRQ